MKRKALIKTFVDVLIGMVSVAIGILILSGMVFLLFSAPYWVFDYLGLSTQFADNEEIIYIAEFVIICIIGLAIYMIRALYHINLDKYEAECGIDFEEGK